jgi:hypothetical protein
MAVNLNNSVVSVEVEILQVKEKLNEQSTARLANFHAVFQVAYISKLCKYGLSGECLAGFHGISKLIFTCPHNATS